MSIHDDCTCTGSYHRIGNARCALYGPPEQRHHERAEQMARDGDMRIEIVKREINQGALAGLGTEITDYAAALVIAALDTYEENRAGQVEALVNALERTEANFVRAVRGEPVRDMAECLAENDAVLRRSGR